jgi:hypothetical protein
MKRAKYWALAASVVLGLSTIAAEAQGPSLISSCQPITQPGSYFLINNLTATGDCLTIQANFVTLDLGGFVITGNGTGSGIAATTTSFHDTTVRNGAVTNFSIGVRFKGLRNATVEKLRVIGNSNGGILIQEPGAIVRDSVATDNGGFGGIDVFGGAPSLVTGNVARNNSTGIITGPGTSVTGNSVGSNTGAGISVICPSLVLGNTVTSNGLPVVIIGVGCVTDHNVLGP